MTYSQMLSTLIAFPPDFLLRWLSDKRPSQTDTSLLLCHLIWPLVTAFFVEPRYYINCFFLHMICIKMKWEEYDRLSLIGMLAFLSSTGQLEEPLDVQSGFEKSRFDKLIFFKRCISLNTTHIDDITETAVITNKFLAALAALGLPWLLTDWLFY